MEKFTGFIVAAIVLFVITAFGFYTVAVFTRGTMTCTVESKDRTTKSGGGSDARVYTEDCGVLQVQDSLTTGNWHSADTYQSIKAGKRYEFETQGIRAPFFSMFPNILEAHEVTS